MASILIPLALLALTTAACAGSSTASGSPATGPPSAASGSANEPRLWIKEGGQVVPFENGHRVTVDGMEVEIYVGPYPPARTATIDFYVTRGMTGVDGATVTLQYDMTVMEHGPFAIAARGVGRGHYVAPLEFPMAGDFWLNTSVETGTSKSVINMFIRAAR